MRVRIYGKDSCSKCKEIQEMLKKKEIEYEYINDKKLLITIGSKYKIMSAPIIEKDGIFYESNSFLEEILWKQL